MFQCGNYGNRSSMMSGIYEGARPMMTPVALGIVIFWLLIMIFLGVGIFYLLKRIKNVEPTPTTVSAKELLDQQYVKGTITEEEYVHKKELLAKKE